ncbi:hypothetical protein ACHWQZ_G016744 [Mnemiopsis leidyi]
MACFDVSSLFTNVPLDETIGITLDRLYRSDVNTPPNLPEHVLKHLLEMCVKDNVFVFNGQVFYQTDGVAMGNPLGPILANIFMAHLEESMIFCGPNIVQPTFYRRYVDDTFCLFTTKEEAERFLVFINNLHPNIQFEMETESDGKLEFLDTVVERRPDSTSHRTSTKVKQTDKGIYYHYSSFIPDSYKLNKIFTLVYRAYRIASDMSVFHVDVEKLKKRLRLNGFPTHLIDQVTSKVLMRYHAQQDNQQDTQQPDRERVYIALPYLGPVSIILKRQLTKLVQKFYPSVQLKVVFRRGFRISNLFNYKDKFPIACRSMIVYYIQFESVVRQMDADKVEREKRRSNVVVLSAPEPEKEASAEQKKKEDKNFCSNVLGIPLKDVETCWRAGKIDVSKPDYLRPLVIKLKSEGLVEEWTKDGKGYKTESGFWINKDLCAADRKANFLAREQRRTRLQKT